MSEDSYVISTGEPDCPPRAEVWVLSPLRQVLVTDLPGVPSCICGYVSDEARQAARARGRPTVSEIGFPSECFLGTFPLPEGGGWGEAKEIAERKARELGYQLVIESSQFGAEWDDGQGGDDV